MEKHPHPFDDFLKETLKGHQLAPREEARKATLAEASRIYPARKGWNAWYYLPVLIIFISGIIALTWYARRDIQAPSSVMPAENPSSTSITDSSLSSISSTPIPDVKSNPAAVPADSHPEEQQISGVTPVSHNEKTVKADQTSNYAAAAELPVNSRSHDDDPSIFAGDDQQSPVPQASDLSGLPVNKDSLFFVTTGAGFDPDSLPEKGIVEEDGKIGDITQAKDRDSDTVKLNSEGAPAPVVVNKSPYYTVTAYYLPEWMFNTIEGGKYVNNFGIEGTFYRGSVSIRTGAGISVSKGITKNSVEYNDYLGTYNKLDSITFIYSESEHNFTPNLFMSSQKVWDSIQKFDSTDVIKRYTYLQVPLVLGFDFWQRGGLTVGVRIGTIMSVLLNSEQLSGPYDPGENQVIGISRFSPDQVSVNWQALGGINAAARLTKDIYIELEPQAKYYYQSIYEKSGNTKKPWSLGARIAVSYKF